MFRLVVFSLPVVVSISTLSRSRLLSTHLPLVLYISRIHSALSQIVRARSRLGFESLRFYLDLDYTSASHFLRCSLWSLASNCLSSLSSPLSYVYYGLLICGVLLLSVFRPHWTPLHLPVVCLSGLSCWSCLLPRHVAQPGSTNRFFRHPVDPRSIFASRIFGGGGVQGRLTSSELALACARYLGFSVAGLALSETSRETGPY